MEDCLFCKIVEKKVPAKVLFEDSHALAFLDILPRAPGHTLVIPKVHAATILDLPDEEIAPLFQAVKRMTARIEERLKPHGFTIGMNHGTVSGQAVPHLHVHIIPRFEGDKGGSIHSVVHHPPQVSLEEMEQTLSV